MLHARSWRAIVSRTPAVNRSWSAVMRVNASSVSTDASVARAAARDSALPASVPPTPPTSS
jgi:hypothetical protein